MNRPTPAAIPPSPSPRARRKPAQPRRQSASLSAVPVPVTRPASTPHMAVSAAPRRDDADWEGQHVHALHILLFDARLTALSARQANDRLLSRVARLVAASPSHGVSHAMQLVSHVAEVRRRDVKPSPRVVEHATTTTNQSAMWAFRAARRAAKAELRLSGDILAARDAVHGGDYRGGEEGMNDAVSSLLNEVIATSQRHRQAHVDAISSAFRTWRYPRDDRGTTAVTVSGGDVGNGDAVCVAAHVAALSARVQLLRADGGEVSSGEGGGYRRGDDDDGRFDYGVADDGRDYRRDFAEEFQRQDAHSMADDDGNPFNAPPPPSTSAYTNRSNRRPSSSSYPYRSTPGNHPTASPPPSSNPSASAYAPYTAPHPYGAPWPPSPHYYYMPPYGHPYGHFPPLYDGTPLHFPLSERLLRDTPSRLARAEQAAAIAAAATAATATAAASYAAAGVGVGGGAGRVGYGGRLQGEWSEGEEGGYDNYGGGGVMMVGNGQTGGNGGGGGGGGVEGMEEEDDREHLTARVATTGKKAMAKIKDFANSDGIGRLASTIVENAPGVPKNVKRMSRISRAVNAMKGNEDEAPSGAELITKGVGYMLNRAKDNRSRHSFGGGGSSRYHSGSVGGGGGGGGVGRLASHAMDLMAGGGGGGGGGRRRSYDGGHGVAGMGELASQAMHMFGQGGGHSGGGRRRYGERLSGRGGRSGGGRRGGRGGRYYGGESESEEDHHGMMSQAMEYFMREGGRGGRGGAGELLGQIGEMVGGGGGGGRRGRRGNDGGAGEAMEAVMNVLGKMRR